MGALNYSKGQVELNETLLVLFFIVIIIIIGVIVYFRVFQEKVKEKGEELGEQEASVLLASITSIGEISCSNEDCVDTSKLIPFSNLARTKIDYYKNIFGYKKITLYNKYPATTELLCDSRAYNSLEYPENCNYWVIYENNLQPGKKGVIISSPISLYYPEINEYRIGILEIEVYG